MPVCHTCQEETEDFYTYRIPNSGSGEQKRFRDCKKCHNKTRNNYIRYRPPYQKKPTGIHKFFTDEQREEAVRELRGNIPLRQLERKYKISYQTLRNLRHAIRVEQSQHETREAPIEESSPTASSSGNVIPEGVPCL